MFSPRHIKTWILYYQGRNPQPSLQINKSHRNIGKKMLMEETLMTLSVLPSLSPANTFQRWIQGNYLCKNIVLTLQMVQDRENHRKLARKGPQEEVYISSCTEEDSYIPSLCGSWLCDGEKCMLVWKKPHIDFLCYLFTSYKAIWPRRADCGCGSQAYY